MKKYFNLDWDRLIQNPYHEIITSISENKGDISIDLSLFLDKQTFSGTEFKSNLGYITYDSSTKGIIYCHRFYPFDEFPKSRFPLLGKGIADQVEVLMIKELTTMFGVSQRYKNHRLKDNNYRLNQYIRLGLDATEEYLLGEILEKINHGFEKVYGFSVLDN